jgi:hypothetical protein
MAIFVVASLLFRLAKATLCYDASGDSLLNRAASPASWANVTENMCTSGAVTWCCSTTDYCLSNGLCVGGGSDNQLLQEGCTSQNWGSPCVKYCPGRRYSFIGMWFVCERLTMQKGSDYQALFECPNTGTEPPGYCCGPDPTSCCANKSYVSVPAGTLILRPFQLAAITSTLSVSSVSPTAALATSTSTVPRPAPSSQSSTGTHTLALALGLGLPLGIGLLAVLLFVGWQLQKYNRLHANGAAVGDSVGSRSNRHANLA